MKRGLSVEKLLGVIGGETKSLVQWQDSYHQAVHRFIFNVGSPLVHNFCGIFFDSHHLGGT